MCGRYVSPTMAEMELHRALSDAQRNNQLGFSQHFNIARTTQIPINYPGDEGIVTKNKKPLGPKGDRNQGVRRVPPSGGGQELGSSYTEKLGTPIAYHNI